MKQTIQLSVNGYLYQVDVEPRRLLVDLLRDDLGLKGTKKGCDSGDCGACSVIMNGKIVNSCMVLAVDAKDKEILTIEGLADGDQLHPLQEAFVQHGAVQCGYCSPGMIMAAKALLDKNPHPNEDDVKRALVGNLCRCTGYTKIIEAVMSVGRNNGK